MENIILGLLKTDLQISTTVYDSFLESLIEQAKEAIRIEGITLEDTTADNMLVSTYAAHLFRKRREDVPMPRMLRWQLNNRLFSGKVNNNG